MEGNKKNRCGKKRRSLCLYTPVEAVRWREHFLLLLLLKPSPHATVVIQPLVCPYSIEPANNSFAFFLKNPPRGITCGGFQEPIGRGMFHGKFCGRKWSLSSRAGGFCLCRTDREIVPLKDSVYGASVQPLWASFAPVNRAII